MRRQRQRLPPAEIFIGKNGDLSVAMDSRGLHCESAPRRSSSRGIVRLLLRCGLLAAMVAILAGAAPWAWAPSVVPAISPYVTLCSLLASRAAGPLIRAEPWWNAWLSAANVIGLLMVLLVLVRHRWCCRYVCPIGLLSEPLSRVRPFQRGAARLPHLGRWIVLATVAGAALGYPLALWLDPLAMLSGAFGIGHSGAGRAGWIAAGALTLIAAAAVCWPHAWCLRVCPLGATQDLLYRAARPGSWRRPAAPAAAATAGGQGHRLSRRSMLSWTGGTLATAAGAVAGLRTHWAAAAGRRTLLRPPGACEERQFPWLCLRCGSCVRACPEGILHPDETLGSITGYLAPLVRFTDKYCKEDCRRCTEVCPSGAIMPFSLQEKPRRPIGVAQVDMTWCLLSPDNGEKECAACRNACPYQAIRYDFNYETYLSFPRVDPHKCPGCGACEVACPGTNEAEPARSAAPLPVRKAISVVPRPSGRENRTI
jgi:ferredoxin